MNCSEVTLRETIYDIGVFCPIKIIFNDLILYNDYDDKYGEIASIYDLVPNRISKFKNSIVKSINITIVEFHHSIVEIFGEYKEEF